MDFGRSDRGGAEDDDGGAKGGLCTAEVESDEDGACSVWAFPENRG